MEASQDELDALKGAVIVESFVKDGGLHICLLDGRVLIFVSDEFALGITHPLSEKLH